MKRMLSALPILLTLALGCGQGCSTERPAGAAGVEDTTAAPSADVGTPPIDTAADTGGAGPR